MLDYYKEPSKSVPDCSFMPLKPMIKGQDCGTSGRIYYPVVVMAVLMARSLPILKFPGQQ